MSNTGEHEEERRWGRVIRLSARRKPANDSGNRTRAAAIWEKPEAAVRGILSRLDTRSERFLASRQAVNLPRPVAAFAARAVFAFEACAAAGRNASWGSFDVSSFARWLGKRENLHPAIVPDLFRALRGVFSWLVVEKEIDAVTAAQIVEDLEATEDEFVHDVIDRHLANEVIAEPKVVAPS
ncbi:MAG: hypothetical protein JRH11_09800 [Deltaproteobacteria bacterium]|nr:hypothetical protein [Deltaproteobacteria bacterium]